MYASILCAGCRGASKVSYTVDLRQPGSGSAEVALEIAGVPSQGLILGSYASTDLLRLSDVVAFTGDGKPLAVHLEADTAGGGEGTQRLRLEGPLPGRVLLRYRVQPGARYGDAHMGYQGKCFGYLDGKFGLLNGQNLFLAPADLESVKEASVRFELPAGWTAVTPWKKQGDVYRPGLDGASVGEHLIAAVIGVGRFRERNLTLDGTRYRWAFESGCSPDDESRLALAFERMTRYVHAILPGHGPPEYVAVIVPPASFGDEIETAGWANGQGGTLAPPTGLRMRRYAERVIEARLTDAPFRRTIRDASELWLIDGVRELGSWRAVARAGYADDGQIARDYAASYASSLRLEGQEWNLERLYSTTSSSDVGRKTAAPLLLLQLDRELRASGGSVGLDSVLASTFHERRVRSLWRSLPGGPGKWRRFREDFAQGRRPLPSQDLFGLSPLAPAPPGPVGKTARTLFIAFTGATRGFLENCGCKVNQSGGVARRATELARLRREHPGAVVIDAGDAFMSVGNAPPDDLSQQEQRLYLETMDGMRYDAVTLGSNELASGPRSFAAATATARLAYTVANVQSALAATGPRWSLVRRGELRIAVVGLFEPSEGTLRLDPYDRHAAEWRIEDPVQALAQLCPTLKARSDVIVVMGRITPFTIRRLSRVCPDVDLVVSTEQDAVLQIRTNGADVLATEDRPGFLGRTYVAYTTLTSYGLSAVELALDDADRVVGAKETAYWLDDKIRDDEAVRSRLTRFYDRVGRTEAAQASVRAPFAGDPGRATGRYVGASRCSTCHSAEYAQWRTTAHASAFKTLLDVHRHYQPRCVACHVVGFGNPTGYHMDDPTLALANVQCEVCHGPGGDHVEAPGRGNIRREVPPGTCLQCHDSEHSDRFDYEQRLPRVLHGPMSPTDRARRGMKRS